MKNVLSTLILFSFAWISAQDKTVKGQFVGDNLNQSYINVININQYKATISQKDGRFEIPAKVGDSILISSVQYSEIKFVIKPEFFEENIEIPLKLKVNELDQVDLYSIGLSGNLEKDIKNIKIGKPFDNGSFDIGNFDISKIYDEKVSTQSEFSLRNVALEQNQIPASVDFKKVFKLINSLFDKKKNENENKFPRKVKAQTHLLEDTDFFVNFLKIGKDQIGQFIDYAKLNGLTNEMLLKSNELDLIQFLIDISENFKTEYGK